MYVCYICTTYHMCMSDSVLKYTSMHRCECILLDLVFPIGRREG